MGWLLPREDVPPTVPPMLFLPSGVLSYFPGYGVDVEIIGYDARMQVDLFRNVVQFCESDASANLLTRNPHVVQYWNHANYWNTSDRFQLCDAIINVVTVSRYVHFVQDKPAYQSPYIFGQK